LASKIVINTVIWNRVTTTAVVAVDAIDLAKAGICRIYPNPSEGVFNISSKSSEPISVEVYTPAGQLLYSDKFTGTYRMDLTANGSGLYLVYMRSADKIQVERLIVK